MHCVYLGYTCTCVHTRVWVSRSPTSCVRPNLHTAAGPPLVGTTWCTHVNDLVHPPQWHYYPQMVWGSSQPVYNHRKGQLEETTLVRVKDQQCHDNTHNHYYPTHHFRQAISIARNIHWLLLWEVINIRKTCSMTPPGWAQLHGGCTCWEHAVYSNYLLGLRSWARTEPYQFAQLIRILQRRETGHELAEDRQRWRVQWVILVLTLHVCAQERKSRCSPLYVSMTLALGCEHVNTHQFLRWG